MVDARGLLLIGLLAAGAVSGTTASVHGMGRHTEADNVDLTITVDNVLEELYIDGARIPNSALPNRLNWPSVDVISIPKTTRVVAVYGRDYGVVAGILASVTGDLLLTSGSWKCVNKDNTPASSTPLLAWFAPDYDDSQWPAASVILSNPNNIHRDIAAISHNAKWIWTAAGIKNSRVLCRGRVTNKPADNVDLTITVDNVLEELYIDGARIPNSALPNRLNWPSVDVISIPKTTRVVAVYGSDSGYIAGILASAAGDLLLTSGSWKCVNNDITPASSTPLLAWFASDYDDSQWPAASVILSNPNSIHGNIAAISHNAKWIWTAAGIKDSRVLCRGRMN